MVRNCQYCNSPIEVSLAPTGGVFRCASCMRLNLLLPQGPDGALQVGHFTVFEEAGQGANAVVCRAKNKLTGEEYALKLFLSDEHAEEHATREFLRESAIAKEIEHKNITRVHECGEIERIPYLLLEYIDGINMAQYMEYYGKMDPFDALSMGAYVCSALDHVWSNFLMIHRDIKPQNIMLTKDGQVKVCDFGMVTEHEMALVDLNAVEGTPYYLAPESITEDAYQDNRADIYSLGATLYHLISGVPPFDYPTVMEVVDARLKEDPPDLRQVCPEAGEGVAAILRTMLARRPDDRYDTAAECQDDMQRVRKRGKPKLVDPNRSRENQ